MGHPVSSGQLSNFWISFSSNTAIFTSIKRSPLLSGRSQQIFSLNSLFLSFTSYIERSLEAEPLK